jgi:S1-C subfamily serine protease
LDNDGHILTNNHLVENAQTIIVTLPSGESFFAVLMAGDVQTDTAVISIAAVGIDLQPAKLGDSSKLVVGQPVLAIGHAFAIPGGPIVTDGIVSATGVSIGASPQLTLIDMILHTAPINAGNSGGPLVNLRAEVVGINTAVIEETRGIGFAINVNDARLVAQQIVSPEGLQRGYVGITPLNLSSELIIQLGIVLPPDVRSGVLITDVREGSPAQEVDMQTGDVIVQIDQVVIKNTGELSKFLLGHPPGTPAEIIIYRGVRRLIVEVTLAEQPQ